MIVQFNTDHNIEGSEGMASHFEATEKELLARFDEDVTRVEIFLKDLNADKGGANDKRCKLEARVKGMDPLLASHDDDSVHKAVKGAADKMKHILTKLFDKKASH